MPEGDTILRTARTLERALAGQEIVRARSGTSPARVERLIGARVVNVEARGKHLLIVFEDGRSLHSHMGMHGSWHLYRPGERWQAPSSHMRCVLETSERVVVCFRAPVVELLSRSQVHEHGALARLGPDILQEDAVAPALGRLRAHGELEIGDALLDQALVAGIGNVYKSEALFICGMDPFARVALIADLGLEHLLRTAQRLMQRNSTGQPRTTRLATGRSQRYWVYRRAGMPCLRCGAAIRVQKQGKNARTTYFCPNCQRAAEAPASGAAR